MTASLYMPDVQVHVAFNAGYLTPAASRTWTDISAYVELDRNLVIQWGRQDERSVADANQLSLVLDNRDGRFTAERATSPYYPNVKLYRPIRVTVTPVGGSPSVRFLGYWNALPVEFDGSDAAAYVSITASSRLARLGAVSSLRSVVETEILLDEPVAYFTLGEPEDATAAADTSGNGVQSLTMMGSGADVVFGQATGPGTDGLTAATFAGGKFLYAPVQATSVAASSVECFFSSSNATDLPVLVQTPSLLIFVNGGVLSAKDAMNTMVGVGVTSPTSVLDGLTHHIAATMDGTTLRLYVDGVEVDTDSTPGAVTTGDVIVGSTTSAATSYVVAHVAEYATALSAARILSHATAGSTGFAGDTTSARLVRYAAYARIPSAEVAAETGTQTMQHVDTTDRAPVDMVRVAEDTEAGVLFDDRDGTLTMHNRAHRYTATSLFTLDMREHTVEADFTPTYDATGLLNDVSAADTSGTRSARVQDKTSRDDYGPASANVTTAAEDDDEPHQLASWLVATYKDPRTRVPSLSVNATAQVGKSPSCEDVLAATVGDLVTVSNQPGQMSFAQADYFIEGGTETYSPESVICSFNVSPSSPWDQVFILGSTTRGVLGTNPLAL